MTAKWCAIVFTGLLVFAVSAGKNDIIIKTSKSWISMENLASVLKVSFDGSTCCNVLIDDEPAVVESFLNDAIKSYPTSYTINRPYYACNDNLFISRFADKLIAELRRMPPRSMNILVAVINDVEETTGLFDGALYGHTHVNLISFNGMWTLSSTVLSPRIFKSVSRFRDMRHIRRRVNLRGRELRAAAYFKPPYCYLWTTVNRTVNGIEQEYFVAKNKSELNGMDVKVFMLIAERLNFTWSIRRRPDEEHWYGVSNGTHWIGGMIGELRRNELDIGFTSVYVSLDKYLFTNLTAAWAMIRVGFLVPRPKPLSSFWALARPLSPKVWSAVLVMLALQSGYVYTSAWVNPRIPRRFRTFVVTWTELMGRLIGTSAPKGTQGLRLQFQLWHFVGTLLITAYSSSLAANLTNPRFEKRIDTPKDFVEANLTWGTRRIYDVYSYAVDYTVPYSKEFESLYVQHKAGERERLLLQGNYAILGNTFLSIFHPEEPIRSEFLDDYRHMKYSPAEYYISFAVQPWLVEPVDKLMLRMRETGMVQHIVDHVLHEHTGNALRQVLIESDGFVYGPTILRLMPLGAGFVMLAVGLTISTVVFYFEVRPKRAKSIHCKKKMKNKSTRR